MNKRDARGVTVLKVENLKQALQWLDDASELVRKARSLTTHAAELVTTTVGVTTLRDSTEVVTRDANAIILAISREVGSLDPQPIEVVAGRLREFIIAQRNSMEDS